MLVVFSDRHQIMKCIGPGVINSMVELGVWEGEFSAFCLEEIKPKEYTLIDFWKYDKYNFVLEDAPQMRQLRAVYSAYFNGEPDAALEEAYTKVQSRFSGVDNIKILRSDVADAADNFEDGSIDLIYLDANHTYEYVLRDLILWYPKLRSGGIFICNDFFEAEMAVSQNIGVISAWTTFSKRFRTFPVAVTSGEWSDFIFSNQPTSSIIDGFRSRLMTSPFQIIEIPDSLISGYQHKLFRVNGKAVRLLPSVGGSSSEFIIP